MIIAINTRCLNKDEPGDCDNYILEVFQRIAQLHNEHTFIFISSGPFKNEYNFPVNIIPVITGPRGNSIAKWFIWYNIKLPLILKKHKANVLVNPGFCSFTTTVPQCLILNDLSFFQVPSFAKKTHLSFYRNYTPSILKKCKTIVTISEFLKTKIVEYYKVPINKIQVSYIGIDKIYQPVEAEERETVKENYAGGNEYFIYSGEITPRNNLINLLKAFSAFKKRQKSSMQLLITSETRITNDQFVSSLQSYKFRNDVKVLTGLSKDENSKLIASAYAMVYASFYENFGTSLLKAMKCEVPVITSSAGIMPELCADAALYANPENFKEIAVKMMQLFRDEKLRKELIEKGKEQVQKFNWDDTARFVWNSIEKTVGTDNKNN